MEHFYAEPSPEKIIGCTLRAGDPAATLSGTSREFCIAVYGDGLDVETVKGLFGFFR